MSETLEILQVRIEGDISKLRRSSQEAIQEVRKMNDQINAELKAIRGPQIRIETSSTMRQISNMNRMIAKSWKDMFNLSIPKTISSGIKNYVKEAQIAAGIRIYTDDYMKLADDIEKAEKSLEELREQKNAIPDSKIREETEDYKELQKYISDTQKKLNHLIERQDKMKALGVKVDSKSWKNLQHDIEENQNALRTFRQDAEDMRKDGSAWQISQQWKEIEAAIYRAEAHLKNYRTEQRQMEASGTDTTLLPGSRAGNVVNTAVATAQRVKSAIDETLSRIPLIGKVSRAASSVASKAFQSMTAVLKSVGLTIKKVSGAFASLLQKFASSIPLLGRIGKSTDQSNKAFKNSIGTILKYGLGIRSLFVLFNKLRSAAVDGVNNLAQYSGKTNASLSLLMSSLTHLKNCFATAFAPILNAAAPLLDVLIQKAVDAVTALGMLLASLTGQSAFVRAKKVNQDYAASLNKNAASADKANEANKRLQRTILGFDEINKLDGGSDSSSGNNGAVSGGLSPSDMFEEVSIASNISEFAEKVKEAWKKADFTEIGGIVADKLNGALANIPWDKIKGTLDRTARSIVTFLNGFVAKADWPLVGSTLGTGINTAVNTLNTLIGNGGINFKQIGDRLSVGLRGAVGTINWKNIGNLLGNYFMISWNILSGFVTGMAKKNGAGIDGWDELSRSLKTAILETVNTIDFDTIAHVLSSSLTGMAKLAIGIFNPPTFEKLGSKIGSGISRFFRTVDWKEVGTAVSNMALSLTGLVKEAIEEINTEDVKQAITDFLSTLQWPDILHDLATILKDIAVKLPDLAQAVLAGLKEGLNNSEATWKQIAEDMFTLLAAGLAIKAAIHGPKIAVAMIGKKIKEAFTSPAKELGESVAEKVFSGFKPKWAGLLKAGVAAGVFAAVLDATSITTASEYKDQPYPSDVSGVVSRLAGGKSANVSEDIEKLKNKILELKETMEVLSDAGEESSEEFQGMRDWVNNLEDAIAEAEKKTGSYAATTQGTAKVLNEASISAGTYEASLVGIPSMVNTQITANTEAATEKVNVFKSLAEKLGLTKFKTQFDAVTQKASVNVQKLTGEANLAAGLKKLIFTADTEEAENKTAGVEAKVDNVKTKSNIDLKVNTSGASTGLDLFTTLKLLVMKALLGSMKLSINTEDAVKSLSDFSEKLQKVTKEKTVKFSPDITSFSKLGNTMYQIGQDAATSFKNGMKSVHIPTPHMYISSWQYHNLGSGGYSYTPNYSVQWYRNGGFPDGELWGMNEAGNPEMVGKVGNRTAVANNAIISEAIKAAVVDGMMEVFMATRLGSGENDNPPVVEVIIKADDETLYKRTMKGKKKAERRYSVTATI